jgi:hypothetical protein
MRPFARFVWATYAMRAMQRLVFILTIGLVVLALYTFQRSGQPDPNMISLAVRATVYAMPSPSPQIVEVTRVVEVTRMVEVVRVVEVTPTSFALTNTVEATPTPTLTPIAAVPTAEVAARMAVAPSAVQAPQETPLPVEIPQEEPETPIEALAAPPAEPVSDAGCPAVSGNQYTTIPVTGASIEHPDSQHADLNLALRGYVPADAALNLVDINGPTDGDAPQLSGVLGRLPTFGRAFRARDWNWACGGLGCRGDELANVEVSLVALDSSPGEAVHVPSRGAEIYGGGFVALVLYADASRLTVVYTREDSVANGYVVHLEDFCVDPSLLALYQSNNWGGRGTLPAVRNGEAVGTARYNQVIVGVRDRGMFTDPRSRKDWWRGY